jgi:hypothetical protein
LFEDSALLGPVNASGGKLGSAVIADCYSPGVESVSVNNRGVSRAERQRDVAGVIERTVATSEQT